MMRPNVSEILTNRVIEKYGALVLGFAKAVMSALEPDREDPEDDCGEWEERLIPDLLAVRPDAFKILADDRVVRIWEIVDTNDITPLKFAKIVELDWSLDAFGWRLWLTRIDMLGETHFDPIECETLMKHDRSHPFHCREKPFAYWKAHSSARLAAADELFPKKGT